MGVFMGVFIIHKQMQEYARVRSFVQVLYVSVWNGVQWPHWTPWLSLKSFVYMNYQARNWWLTNYHHWQDPSSKVFVTSVNDRALYLLQPCVHKFRRISKQLKWIDLNVQLMSKSLQLRRKLKFISKYIQFLILVNYVFILHPFSY